MKKKRLTWIDLTKGLLMIFVVMGHYPGELNFPLSKYIYWFHMPAFFIMSGLFFKPLLEKGAMLKGTKRRFMQLIVPYLFFIVLITVIRYGMEIGYGNTDLSWYLNDLWKIVIGGRFVRGAYGVFWFVTTMFFSFIIFTLITKYLSRGKQLALLVVFYLVAHIESLFVMQVIDGSTVESAQSIPVLWNVDVALMAVVYLAIGYYGKEFWMKITNRVWFGAISVAVLALLADQMEWTDYELSMKFLNYEHFALDLIIPVTFTIVLIGLFQRISLKMELSVLQRIQKHSISIMYLHIFADIVLNDFFTYGLIGYTLIGIVVPICISLLIEKTVPFGQVLLGGYRPKRPSKKVNRLVINK